MFLTSWICIRASGDLRMLSIRGLCHLRALIANDKGYAVAPSHHRQAFQYLLCFGTNPIFHCEMALLGEGYRCVKRLRMMAYKVSVPY